MNSSKAQGPLRRVNEAVAPNGWTRDINLDLPLWRYVVLAIIFTGGFMALAFAARGWSVDNLLPRDWVVGAAIAAVCLAPPVLRRFYLRRKRFRQQVADDDRTDAEAYERGYPDRSK